ncbi:MBL fold metallo-hydrolase [Pseudonocardiaceae bacterium YIM PH 21723]|nr:MBL fold metallo-hydrolase [Pseudonocardiaceae bacterium YIM PH 21723]
MIRGLREGGFEARTSDAVMLPFRQDGLIPVADGQGAITWAGHASFVIRMAGRCVLADPVWSTRIPGVRKRLTPIGLPWEQLPRVDAVVISHNHYDHLDAPTIERLPRDTPILVPGGLGEWFTRRRFTEVIELDWWESATVGSLTFDFVPSHHWSRRGVFDSCRSLWGGWVITDPAGLRVYHAGDTGYGHWFREIGERYPGIELSMLPIGAYAPRAMLKPVHMDPEEAVAAHGDLGARLLATMHWASFMLSAEPLLEPLQRVRAAWTASGRPLSDLLDLPVGGSAVFDRVS